MTKEEFGKLSPAQQRVEIAKDVIRRLEAGKIVAAGGAYCDATLPLETLVTPESVGSAVDSAKCTVCALGALFVSMVVHDGVPGDDIIHNVPTQDVRAFWVDHPGQYLAQLFDEKEIDRIEDAFEGFGVWHGRGPDRYADRLLAIMNNIINNQGEFTLKPEIL